MMPLGFGSAALGVASADAAMAASKRTAAHIAAACIVKLPTLRIAIAQPLLVGFNFSFWALGGLWLVLALGL